MSHIVFKQLSKQFASNNLLLSVNFPFFYRIIYTNKKFHIIYRQGKFT